MRFCEERNPQHNCPHSPHLPEVHDPCADPHAAPPSPSSTLHVGPPANVLLPTALALLLGNMDRICLSVAIMPMAAEFGWPASLQVRVCVCVLA